MNWLRTHKSSAWICGLTLLVPVLLYLDALLGLWSVRQDYQADIDRLLPRMARLEGLIAAEEDLQVAAAQVDRQVLDLVYPASEPQAEVSASLQKQVREVFTDAGLSVTNSQVLPVKEQGNFDYISIKLLVSGDMNGLDAALAGIGAYMPLILVESLEISPSRQSRRSVDNETQEVTASLQLLSLRAAN
jgi:general secretion pathway protein M